MSVYAKAEFPDGAEIATIPVCPASSFDKFIYPVASKKNLSLVLDWGTMTVIDSQNSEEFINQIRLLIDGIENEADFRREAKDNLREVLGRLRDFVIENLKSCPSATFYIG